jgi:hypothetical protein
MIKNFPTNEFIQLNEIGNPFTIKSIQTEDMQKSFAGKLILSEMTGEKYKKDLPANIDIIIDINNLNVKFIATIVKFEIDNINSISLEIS